MRREFKAGDVVVLNSGGPPMTVIQRTMMDDVYCTWINDADVIRSTFPSVCLKPYVPVCER